jgi:eukaryotic-like serine/threonine-protein kinase
MKYCINPHCKNPQNPNTRLFCCSCGSELLLEGCYQVVQLLERRPYTALYEVLEQGQEKILKVLEQPYHKLVELFEQEAKVLLSLNHPGIPKGYRYFQFQGKDTVDVFPCLVMEKIQGVNLQKYIEQRENRPIKEELAVGWLLKLANILEAVHEQRLFHRDIKPSNIMLTHDGELVLIDFGAVRELTDTYPESLAREEITTVSSKGYTAPEQCQSQAVPQSDFFALGRTLVYLLTGVEPYDFPKNPNEKNRLIWRNKASISNQLADFLDKLMAPSPKDRPQDTKAILQELTEIQEDYWATKLVNSNRETTEKTARKNKDVRQVNQEKIFATIWLKGIVLGLGIATIFVVSPRVISWLSLQVSVRNSVLIGDHLSYGEEILIPESAILEKQKGIEAYAAGQYDKAVEWFQKAREKQPQDPEVLIYLNNAWIKVKKINTNVYTIAVAVPLSNNPYKAMEILRGVAQAQNALVGDVKTSNIALKVLIADDANNPTQAQKIAKALTSQPDIVGVVGHYASEITLATRDIYEQQRLVLVSPGSTSASLPRPGDKFFFRTVPTVRINASRMVSHLNDIGQKKVAIFYTSKSNFSRSLKEQFIGSFGSGRQIVHEFDLSDPFFSASAVMEKVEKQGATALVIIPDGGTSRYSFSNAIQLIQANRGRFWMVGANTLESRDVLLLGKDTVDRLVITIPWIAMTSPNQEFPKEAKNLWKEGEINSRTASAYDATQVLIKALQISPSPNRQKLQETLSKDDFKAWGATGDISFVHDGSLQGDRKEDLVQSIKIIRSQCSNRSYMFVPLEYEQNTVNC